MTRRGGPQLIPRPPDARVGPPPPWSRLQPHERRIDVARVRDALAAGPPPRPSPLEASTPRTSAVLAALFDDDGEASVLLTRRARHLRAHRGEVSFPGGAREGDEPLVVTALREAHEEVGLDPSTVDVVGELDHLATVSSASSIVPYVGVLPGRPEDLVAAPEEVDQILLVPLSELLLDGVYREEVWATAGAQRSVHFFELVGDTVWGATAAMLRQLLLRSLGLG